MDNNNNKTYARKLGRAARRRRGKIRAIRQSVQILLYGVSPSQSDDVNNGGDDNDDLLDEIDSNSCLPTDRGRSLPGVIIRRKQFNTENNDSMTGDDTDKDEENTCIDKDDEKMLTSQLGFIPGNSIFVAARVKDIKELYPRIFYLLSSSSKMNRSDNLITDGNEDEQNKHHQQGEFPVVLQLYPLVERDVYDGGKSDGRKFKSRKRGHSQAIGSDAKDEKANIAQEASTTGPITIEPFPTMYWLTHPHLRTLISQLELEPTQNVKSVEEKLSSCPDHLRAMRNAHVSYGKERWQLLTDEDKDNTEKRKWVDALGIKRGIAGITNFESVKCLHAHAAHYLAQCGSNQRGDNTEDTENVVGRWVLEAVEELIINGGKVANQETSDD